MFEFVRKTTTALMLWLVATACLYGYGGQLLVSYLINGDSVQFFPPGRPLLRLGVFSVAFAIAAATVYGFLFAAGAGIHVLWTERHRFWAIVLIFWVLVVFPPILIDIGQFAHFILDEQGWTGDQIGWYEFLTFAYIVLSGATGFWYSYDLFKRLTHPPVPAQIALPATATPEPLPPKRRKRLRRKEPPPPPQPVVVIKPSTWEVIATHLDQALTSGSLLDAKEQAIVQKLKRWSLRRALEGLAFGVVLGVILPFIWHLQTGAQVFQTIWLCLLLSVFVGLFIGVVYFVLFLKRRQWWRRFITETSLCLVVSSYPTPAHWWVIGVAVIVHVGMWSL